MTHAFAAEVRQRLRLLILLLRPALVLLLMSSAVLGMSATGHARDLASVPLVLLAVLGFLLTAVAVNDISDREVDQLNLPGKASRPLASGVASARDMSIAAVVGSLLSLGSAWYLGRGPLLVAVAGQVLALTYSLKPFAVSGRGAAASLLLLFGFVAVPYLTGVLATGGLTWSRAVLLAGLYVGFIGRILLKDFRDVVGDTLLGKRTFLVRHGRRTTCRLSAAFWGAGSIVVLLVVKGSVSTEVAYAIQAVAVLLLLRQLSRSDGYRQDEAFISAIAILGRGCLAVLIGHFALTASGVAVTGLLEAGITVMSLQFAWAMARSGPISRLRVPAWTSPVRQEQLSR